MKLYSVLACTKNIIIDNLFMINILLMQDMIVGGARIEGSDAITPITAEALACLATYEMVVASLPFLEQPSYADNSSLKLPHLQGAANIKRNAGYRESPV